MKNSKSIFGSLKFDARTIFVLAALVGAGSLFVTTLTSDAPETFAVEGAKEVPEGKTEDAAGAAKEAPAPVDAVAAKVIPPKKNGCLTDEVSITDAQEMKRDLAKRDAELKRRESEVAAKEIAVAEELKKLDSVRDEIKQAQSLGDSKSEEKVGKLVETFESMSPKAAAAIVASVDERLAVEAMARLSSAKLGKILAAMDPAKSAPLAEKLAGVVRAKTRSTASIGAAETTNRVKGGEENGNLKQSNTDAVNSRQPEPALGREPASSEKR
jgi:flagellar motility protein MotE (MotC chaperone)